jgi:hypothetical protein
MNGGKINDNTASYISYSTYGGGVYIKQDASFTMNGGELSGNSASTSSSEKSYGGGVYAADGGMFTMNSGAISKNTANYGGGVGVASAGFFTKASGGGVIYGSDGGTLQNTADDANCGYAVFVSATATAGSKRRNTTAGTAVELDSTTSGSAGGWE